MSGIRLRKLIEWNLEIYIVFYPKKVADNVGFANRQRISAKYSLNFKGKHTDACTVYNYFIHAIWATKGGNSEVKSFLRTSKKHGRLYLVLVEFSRHKPSSKTQVLSGFPPSFFRSTKCYLWTDSSIEGTWNSMKQKTRVFLLNWCPRVLSQVTYLACSSDFFSTWSGGVWASSSCSVIMYRGICACAYRGGF